MNQTHRRHSSMLKTQEKVTVLLTLADVVEATRLKVPFALVGEYLKERKSDSDWKLKPVKRKVV